MCDACGTGNEPINESAASQDTLRTRRHGRVSAYSLHPILQPRQRSFSQGVQRARVARAGSKRVLKRGACELARVEDGTLAEEATALEVCAGCVCAKAAERYRDDMQGVECCLLGRVGCTDWAERGCAEAVEQMLLEVGRIIEEEPVEFGDC